MRTLICLCILMLPFFSSEAISQEETENVVEALVVDAETGEELWVDTASSAVRRAHREWWVQHQSKLNTMLTKSNVDNVSVRTDEDYVKSLMNLFRRRS